MEEPENKEMVGLRLKQSIIDEIDDKAVNRSQFIRTAIKDKLGRSTPHQRIDRVERDVDDIQDQIREIRSALINEAASGYNSYGEKAGDTLTDDES